MAGRSETGASSGGSSMGPTGVRPSSESRSRMEATSGGGADGRSGAAFVGDGGADESGASSLGSKPSGGGGTLATLGRVRARPFLERGSSGAGLRAFAIVTALEPPGRSTLRRPVHPAYRDSGLRRERSVRVEHPVEEAADLSRRELSARLRPPGWALSGRATSGPGSPLRHASAAGFSPFDPPSFTHDRLRPTACHIGP